MSNLSYFWFFICFSVFAQQHHEYQVMTVAFYNVENLFDTEDDPFRFDDDRTPEGKDAWTRIRYQLKLNHISKVIAEIGNSLTRNSPEIIGLAEIENRKVLEDLLNTPILNSENYDIIHFDSPDRRGIDVALLYNKNIFIPKHTKAIPVELITPNSNRKYTRDILVCTGTIENENFAFIVNHWPSRSGGEKASRNYRESTALVNRRICDSIWATNASIKIVNMGDFNDDPKNKSVKKLLKTSENPNQFEFYNPMLNLYKNGMGSLAYRDHWNLFDQILVSGKLTDKNYLNFQFYQAGIFSKDYLITKNGKYKGYPFRTYGYNGYLGGYSDHFPVYLYLVKKKNPH
ncbi:endonuclease/exonuclease/phosphatase family protein [Zunongwangia sp.]|uniref:endonuclease/exonuclease/phosphatase family protein n=1 Tax=Zunongwangia sp. TaxID=1965325 RepID=UPI003AA81144